MEHGRWVARTGGGLHHIAYRTNEYDRYRQHVLDLGGTPVFEQETEDELQGYRRCTYFQMPGDGGVIEILEAAYFRK